MKKWIARAYLSLIGFLIIAWAIYTYENAMLAASVKGGTIFDNAVFAAMPPLAELGLVIFLMVFLLVMAVSFIGAGIAIKWSFKHYK